MTMDFGSKKIRVMVKRNHVRFDGDFAVVEISEGEWATAEWCGDPETETKEEDE